MQKSSIVLQCQHHQHRIAFWGAVLALALVLAACGSSTPAASSSPTSVPASSVKGDFLGQIAALQGGIALSSNGQQIIAYVCNGTSVVQWFKGSVSNNGVDVTAKGMHLLASLTAQAATGSVTLADGKSYPFTASVIDEQGKAGLYRSEQTIGGVRYLGGWLVFPSSATQTAHQVFMSLGFLTTRLVPLYPAIQTGPQAVINEQTGTLLFAPILTATDIAAGQVQVPSLGTFALVRCRLGTCK